jgi:Tol biopolymer transport system component
MYKKNFGTIILLFLFMSSLYGVKGPQRLIPAKNSILTALDPVFVWKPIVIPGITYEIKIAENQEFTINVIQLRTTSQSLKFSLPYFQNGKSYYWTIRAVYTENQQVVETTWSHENKQNPDHFQFTIDNKASGFVGYKPLFLAPEQNSVLNTLQPEFKWLFPDHSDLNCMVKNVRNEWVSPKLSNITYQLVISSSQDFQTGAKTFEIKNDSLKFRLSIPWLNKGIKYYWKVKAIYRDPEKEIIKESEWTSTAEETNTAPAFEISQQAKGTFGFNEGQKEEMFEKSKLKGVLTPLTSATNNCFAPAVSEDGQKLAYCSTDRFGQTDIYEISLTERISGSTLGTQKASFKGKLCLNPFWLPGSSDVSFYSNRMGEFWRLWYTTKGTAWGILYNEDMDENQYDFELFGSCTSDGKAVFTGKTKNSKLYDLYLLDIKSNGKPSLLLQGMSPDIGNDDRIVYSYCDPAGDPNNFDIYIGNLETNGITNPSILTNDTKSDYDPVFSPDGTRIAFTSTRSGNSDIWVMDSDGSKPTQLTFHPLVDRRPQWINNETIVFQSNRVLNDKNEPVYCIFKMDVPK